MTNNYSTKRIIAYFLDMMIVIFISSLLTVFLPVSEKYNELNEEFTSLIEKYTSQEITMEEYFERNNDISYELSKESVMQTIVTIVISTFYYVVIIYFMNGQTLGKKILKIKIVSNNDKKLSMNNYLIRAFLINSILMNALSVITILFLSKSAYLKVYNSISYLFTAIMVVSLTMMLFRKDGRGLHDILANTKVITINNKLGVESLEEKEEKIVKKDILDAEIIEKHKKKDY